MFLNEMRKFINGFIQTRYKNSFNVKLPKNIYNGDLECSYLGGSLSMCEEVFKRNKQGKFENKDDVIADLHLLYVECYNEFQRKYGYKVVDKATLEKPIKLSEVQNDSEITFC